jgi:ABC-type molybdate transport system substrate-binding protein
MSRYLLLACALFVLGGAAPAVPDGTFACFDDSADLHGDPAAADLVVFAGGNQWFAMPELFAAFQRAHPEVRRIFYETLPPGILAQQLDGGALTVGELTLSVRADAFMAGGHEMDAQRAAGTVDEPVTYASNELAILVPAGNPKHVTSLADLGRADVRVAMPNPQTEGVARQIVSAYRKAGGDALVQRIMETKRAAGTTILTSIHHRQTPAWLLQGKADAGPVWLSEALYQERIHSGLEAVRIPAAENVSGAYLAAVVRTAAHVAAAKAFVAFLASQQAQDVYRSYGFAPAPLEEQR